jgi:hypothetical protein
MLVWAHADYRWIWRATSRSACICSRRHLQAGQHDAVQQHEAANVTRAQGGGDRARVNLQEPFRLANQTCMLAPARPQRRQRRASAARAGGGNAAPQCQLEATSSM